MAQRKAKASEADIGRAAVKLEIVRIFDAPRALVYEMWSTPGHLGKWDPAIDRPGFRVVAALRPG